MDLYKILQVPSDADVATIEKAFRKLSIKLHPDKANVSTIPSGHVETREEKEAREQRNNEKFAEIAHARDVLTDTKKREEYDRQRRRNARPESSNETKEGRRPHDRKSKAETSRSSDNSTNKRIDEIDEVYAAVTSIGDDLSGMLRELQRIGQRPMAFDREYSNLTLKFHGAISWNSTLINLVTGTKDRLLEIQRSRNLSPRQKESREREADEVLAKTRAAIPRGKQFTTILRHAFADPLAPHDPIGILFDRLRNVFDSFPDQVI